ncbi:hypothetical protein SmJEL517_g03385 [Synchytrium microbalum]|uniref:Uncharacterized protein n=1 Tax=Synchytrium microbalum TaxID=1806994 RepID=A0A507C382_9FUNG|nr:uncharacterized protein SmJEL517_g03385 [Synchytrium microbalum]TPX33911.1 hypothetical protein SmJEL517_g03385 [Synchytrium microbalum]
MPLQNDKTAGGVSIDSCVTREKSLHDVNPALGSQHSDLHHRFVVLHLSNGKAKTVEYGHFDPHQNDYGTIRIHDGAQAIHAFVDALDFDTTGNNGYDWNVFEKWVLGSSGYQNTAWSREHQSQSFIDTVLAHLKSHTKPAAPAASNAQPLNVKAPDADANAVFDGVKPKVLHKIQEIHHKDIVHHTHLSQDVHSKAYKVVQYAVVEAPFGFQYFAKVSIGDVNYVHARAHKFHQGGTEFHSLYLTRDSAILSKDAPLVYFDE